MMQVMSYAVMGQFQSLIVLIGALVLAALITGSKPELKAIGGQALLVLSIITLLETPAVFSAFTPVIFIGSIFPFALYATLLTAALLGIKNFYRWIDKVSEGHNAPNR